MRLFSKEARERAKRLNRTPAVRRAAWFGGAVLVFVVLYLVLLYVILSPPFTGWLWQSAMEEDSPACGLLTGCLRWYWVLLAVCGGGVAVNVLLFLIQAGLIVWNVQTFRRLWREEAIPQLLEAACQDTASPEETIRRRARILERYDSHALASLLLISSAVLCIIAGMLCWAIFDGENIAALPRQAREDLAQIDAAFLETAEVWISPKTHPARLPGPYSSGQPTLAVRFGIIGADTDNQWVQILIPDAMDFSLDPDRLFDETKSVQWNWEHAQRYRVRYTSNFHLAAEVLPVS